jgi:glycerate-2-kinase
MDTKNGQTEKENWIKNWDIIATSEKRKTALSIASAGLDAINTERVIHAAMSISDSPAETLHIKDRTFDLSQVDAIRIIGFGKVVCQAVTALEDVLGDRIKSGIVIGTEATTCNSVIESFTGSHPIPSPVNVKASAEIVTMAKSLSARDLVIVVVSGGGSSLLCWPPEECDQGKKLYEDFLKTGGTIEELNTVRKHISLLKGGGLAKMLYPATVVGLIFSDVPGQGDAFYATVASGPTYPDSSTTADAENILKKYGFDLSDYTLNETPKDTTTDEKKYFEKVTNIPLVSNYDALEAMTEYGRTCGFVVTTLSSTIYDPPEIVVKEMFEKARDVANKNSGTEQMEQTEQTQRAPQLILAGGEPKIEVPAQHGRGGRNEHTALEALRYLASMQNVSKSPESPEQNSVFISLASDGHDNNSAAGAIADSETLKKAADVGLEIEKCLTAFDAYSFFEKTGDLIITGQTETNVSDLMVLLY